MNKRPEIIITFSDIWYGILRCWRLIVVLALLGAIAMGVYSYATCDVGTSAALEAQANVNGLSAADAEAVLSAVELKQLYKQMITDYDSSYVTKLDENKVQVTTINYYVDAQIPEGAYDYTTDLCVAYMAAGLGDSMMETYRSTLEYLNQSLEDPNTGIVPINQTDLGYLLSADYNGRTVTFTIRTDCEDFQNELLMLSIEHELQLAAEEIAQTIGIHHISYVNHSSLIGPDATITEAKLARAEALATAKKSASDAYEHVKASQRERVDALVTVQGGDYGTTYPRTVGKKKVVLGGIMGGVLGVIIAICHFVWNKKITAIAELEQGYGLNVYGRIVTPRQKHARNKGKHRHPASAIDRAIMKKQYQVEWNSAYEKQLALATERIVMNAEAEGYKRLYLVSTDVDIVADTMKELAESLRSRSLKVSYVDTMDPVENLKGMAEAGRVVFVERLGESKRSNLRDLLKLCEEQRINVAGAVTLI